VCPRNHVLDEIQIPHGKGHCIVTYLRMSALRIVRLPPRANVRAQRTRTDAFAAATKRRCGFLPNCFGYLFSLRAVQYSNNSPAHTEYFSSCYIFVAYKHS